MNYFANENNLGKVHFVEEKISGAIHWKKRELGSIIESMSEGDHLIVSEFSRLGRSMLECMEIMSHLCVNFLNDQREFHLQNNSSTAQSVFKS